MEKELGLKLLPVRFGDQFISGDIHISFVREADIERLQLFGKIFGRALRGLKRGRNLILPIKHVG